ncbi:MAG: response regulator transcription factor [candidate division NC10 bacterium]|nr:response regulator transcription factor [candidate division NC10 bacterium]
MTRILVVDDHAIVRQGLKQILADTPDLVVAGEASTGQEALEKVRTGQWDVVILNISLPDRSGVTVLEQLKTQYPDLPVLMLSMYAEEQYAVRVMKAGAAGYLPKESAPDQLVSAIHKVARGGKYVSPTLMEKFVSDLGTDPKKPRHEILSAREFQVLCMIAGGKSLTEIAEDLGVSVKTISTHRTRMLKKMELKTNADLIHYAIRTGLVR